MILVLVFLTLVIGVLLLSIGFAAGSTTAYRKVEIELEKIEERLLARLADASDTTPDASPKP